MKSRKYKIYVNSILPCDSKFLFDEINLKNAVHYLGLYLGNDDQVLVYVHFKNVLDIEKLRETMKKLSIEVKHIEIYSEIKGIVQSEYGEILKRGRPTMNYHPKLRLSISPACIDSNTIYEQVKTKYSVVYCGIHEVNGDMYVYLHNRERMVPNVIRRLLGGILDISDISKFSSLDGNIIEYTGKILKHGGHKKSKKGTAKPPQPPQSITTPQPATSLPEPKTSNCIHILENVYKSKVSSPADLDSFHAVWSSVNGIWSPVMWVGPSRNLSQNKRTSLGPKLIQEMFEEQDSKCRLCRTHVFMGTFSNSDVDHIIPLRLGGTSSKSNLQVLCVTCHRRKTALECKKVVTLMGDPCVEWGDKVYLVNTHIHFDFDSIESTNPKDGLEKLGASSGLFVLD